MATSLCISCVSRLGRLWKARPLWWVRVLAMTGLATRVAVVVVAFLKVVSSRQKLEKWRNCLSASVRDFIVAVSTESWE